MNHPYMAMTGAAMIGWIIMGCIAIACKTQQPTPLYFLSACGFALIMGAFVL